MGEVPNMREALTQLVAEASMCWFKTPAGVFDSIRAAALCEAFLDRWQTQAWLGNATTGELLEELRARCEVNGTIGYRTVDGGADPRHLG